MNFTSIALSMYPYWLLGIAMIIIVYFSKYREILHVNKRIVLKWATILLAVIPIKLALMYCLGKTDTYSEITLAIKTIPWQMTLFVFWEDACHTMPLYILDKMTSTNWFIRPVYYALFLAVMVSFASGHAYEGSFAMISMLFYVPGTMYLAKKYGFGSIMICHVIYDLYMIGMAHLL